MNYSTNHFLAVVLWAGVAGGLNASAQEQPDYELRPLVTRYAKTATKADVKAAVEKIFAVKVEAVNVVNVKGKSKTFKFRQGRRGDWRKAYVTLAEGQSIDVMTASA